MTEQGYYQYRYKDDLSRNIRAWEIIKPGDELPFTVLVYDYSNSGDAPLFADLFVCQDWDPTRGQDGQTSHDIHFLRFLWNKLGLETEYGEEFLPKHINLFPNRSPLVYRRKIEDVFALRFGL